MLSGVVAAASPASAAAGFALDRIAGDNRYETSARVAAAFGPTNSAILASGETGHVVDALSANFLAGVQQAPVLLTTRNSIPASVRAVLNNLTGTKNVTIVGGTAAVSAAVEAELRTAGFTVTRLAGSDRYATSEALITSARAQASNIGILASGTNFPDALAGGPLAYKGKHPVFLTAGGSLPQDTIDAMVAAGTTRVIILGGTAAVPASVETALAARNIQVVTRLGGADRSETSRLIADYLITNMGFTNTTFNVASGAPRGEGADALTGAALSGKQNRALLITATQTQAAPVVAFATARANTLTATGTIFGGTAAVSQALEDAIEAAGRQTVSNQTFAVTQTGGNNVFLGGDVASRTRTFTATVPAGTSVDIQLFAASNVMIAANGTVTFTDTDNNNQPEAGDIGDVTITSVNGVPGAGANNVTSNGTVTFTVQGGTQSRNVVPVIFADQNNNNVLDLAPATGTTAKVPTEPFALGATTNFLPALAAFGNQGGGAQTIVSAPAGGGFFTTATSTFTFDDNDVFQYQGVGITRAQFESLLGAGATVTANFSPTAAGVSTFNVQTANLAAVTTLSAQVRNLDNETVINDVQVTYTRPAGNPSGTTYTLQRSSSTGTPAFTTITTATQAAGTGTGVFVFTDMDVPNGTYIYRVVATGAVTGAVQNSAPTTTVTIPGTVETDRPTTVSTRLVTNAGFPTDVDAGDVFRIIVNEDIALSGTTAIRFTDRDNDQFQLTSGTNATFALNPASVTFTGSDAGTYAANRVLTVTVTGNPTPINGATAADLPAQYGITINTTAGIADLNGNLFNPGANVAAVQEVQTVTSSATGGTYTLSFDGQTTGNLAYNASVADITSALEGLDNITDVTVTATANGFTVTFVNPAGNVSQLVLNGGSLTGGTATVTTTTGGVAGSSATTIQP